jgi:hypothetical protein
MLTDMEVFRCSDRGGIQTEVAFRPVSDFQIEEVSNDQVEVLVAFRPVFRFPDRSGVQTRFPVIRPTLILSYSNA